MPLTSVAWRWFFPFCLVLFLPNALVQNHLALPSMVCKWKVDLACREGLIDALLCTTSSSVEKKMLILWLYSPLLQNFYLRPSLLCPP